MDEALSVIVMLLAGLLTSFSPCLFPVLPAYLMYAARRAGRALRVSIAFTAAMTVSLVTYALAAATLGQALVALLNASPYDAATFLSTFFLILSVMQLTPAKELGSLTPRISFASGKLDAAGAAVLGALFALLAAPCASGPILALTAKVMLDPGSAIPSVIAFSAGAAAPFLAMGALAQSLGQRIHRRVSQSVLVKRSGELTALLFAMYGVLNFFTVGNPLLHIRRLLPLLCGALSSLWSVVLLAYSIFLMWLSARIAAPITPLAAVITMVGALSLLKVLTPPMWILSYMVLSTHTLAVAAWLIAYGKGGGRVTKWTAVVLVAALVARAFEASEPTITGFGGALTSEGLGVLLAYSLCIISFALIPTPVALMLDASSVASY